MIVKPSKYVCLVNHDGVLRRENDPGSRVDRACRFTRHCFFIFSFTLQKPTKIPGDVGGAEGGEDAVCVFILKSGTCCVKSLAATTAVEAPNVVLPNTPGAHRKRLEPVPEGDLRGR